MGYPPQGTSESAETRENIKKLADNLSELNDTIKKNTSEMKISSERMEKYTKALLYLTAILAIIGLFQIFGPYILN